ncbi:hypothetical protein M3J09_007639 [Ascochyta lentis]
MNDRTDTEAHEYENHDLENAPSRYARAGTHKAQICVLKRKGHIVQQQRL